MIYRVGNKETFSKYTAAQLMEEIVLNCDFKEKEKIAIPIETYPKKEDMFYIIDDREIIRCVTKYETEAKHYLAEASISEYLAAKCFDIEEDAAEALKKIVKWKIV